MSAGVSTISKPAGASTTQAMLSLLQELKEEQPADEQEIICHALQHYLAKVEELCRRREPGMHKIANGETTDTENMASQDFFPTRVKAHAALKQVDVRESKTGDDLKCTDGLQFGMDFVDAVAVAQMSAVSVCSSERIEDDLEGAFENTAHATLQSPPDHMLTTVPKLIQYFEIMSFKTIRETDCESEASADISTEVQTEISTPLVDIHALDRASSSTSVDGSQVSTDTLCVEFEDILLPRQSSGHSLHEGKHDIEVAFEKICAVEKESKSCRQTDTRKNFMKRMQEKARNRNDLTDALDVMAMAIQ